MSRKQYCLIGLVAILIGLYVVCFTDWFRPKVIRIEHSTRVARKAAGRSEAGNLTFSLQGRYRLNLVKVVALADYQTNRYARPLWELVSDSGSQPIDGFAYGIRLPGMRPAEPQLEPDPLEPEVEYRLIVEAGHARGEHDFKIRDKPVNRR